MHHRYNLTRWLVITISGITVITLVLPPAALAIRALRSEALGRVADDPGILTALLLSLRTTSLAAICVVTLGIPLAYVMARYQFRFKSLITLLIQLPIVLPPSVAGLALLLTYGRRGLLSPILEPLGISIPFSMQAVIVAQIYVSLPFFIRAAEIGFRSIPEEIIDAAHVDGASGILLFRTVTLPLSWYSLVAGLMLAWTRALGEFGATILFAGSLEGETQTMPLLVYSALERDIDIAIWAGVILVATAMGSLALLQYVTQRSARDTRDYVQL